MTAGGEPGGAPSAGMPPGGASPGGKQAAATPGGALRTVPFIALFRFADARDRAAGAVALLCALGSGVVVPVSTLLLGALLNDTSGYASRVDAAALYLTLLGVGSFLCLGGGVVLASLSAQRQAARLRRAYVRALLRQDIAWGEAEGLAEAAARLAEDSLTVAGGIGEKIFLVVSGAAQFLGSIVLAFALAADAWRLALTLLAALPAAVAAIGGLFTFVAALAGDSDDAYARAGAVLAESLALARTVAALGGEEHEAARYDTHLATAERAGVKKGVLAGASQGVFLFTMAALYAIGLYSGARFIGLNRDAHHECDAFGNVNGSASFACFSGGSVVQVLFAIVGGAFSLGIMVPNLGAVAAARAAAARLHAVIERVPPIDALAVAADGLPPPAPRPAVALPTPPFRIAFEGVSFAYPARPTEPILTDFNLVIEGGARVALVGTSGSGKSTVIALLSRMYDVSGGRVTIGGVDIRDVPLSWLRAQLAVVAQEPQLLPLSVHDNIAAGSGADAAAVEATAALADATPFVEALPAKFETLVTSAQLSGGQKQRLCIARALARRAPVLCFDEATSALDSRSEAAILGNIAAAAAAAPASAVVATHIVVAHRLSTVRSSDTIFVMDKGRVVEKGSHDALLAAGETYARLWTLGAGSTSESSDASAAAGVAAAMPSERAAKLADATGPNTTIASDNSDSIGVPAKRAAPLPGLWAAAWRLQRPEAGTLSAAIVLSAINGVALPAFAILITQFVSIFYLDTSSMIAQATIYMGFFFALALAMFTLNTLQGVAFAAAGEPFVRRLRRAAFASIIAQPAAFFESPGNAAGRLAASLGIDAAKLKLALGPRLGEKIGSLATLVAGVIVCFIASWELTLVIAALMPFVVLAADAENRVTFGTEGAAEKEGLATAVGIAAEAAAAVRVVHAFALEDAVSRRFADALRGPRRVALHRALALGLGFGSSQALQSIATAVIFKVGLALMMAGRTTPDRVILCFFSFQFASFGLPNLVSLSGDLAAIRASVKSIFGLVRRVPEIDGSEAAEAAWAASGAAALAMPAAGRLELRDVYFAYPSRPAAVLNGVSLVVEPGQTAALVGPSGCGKSSVVALFLRLYDAQAGAVLVDGLDARARPARVLRDRMGWVGQEAPLFADTISYNVAYGRAGGASK